MPVSFNQTSAIIQTHDSRHRWNWIYRPGCCPPVKNGTATRPFIVKTLQSIAKTSHRNFSRSSHQQSAG